MKLHLKNHDTFLVNKNSELANKSLTVNDLKSQIIYVPREYEQTTKRIKELTQHLNINIKVSNYRSIVRLINEGMVIGVVTAEYLYDWEWENFNLQEVKNDIGLGEVEFGIYLNSSQFIELKRLVEMIKEYFFTLYKKENYL